MTGTWKGRGEVAGEIQRGFGRAFMAFLWANAGLVALAGAWRGTLPLELSLPAGLALAGIPTLLWTRMATRGSAPVIGSTALACLVALLVAAFRHDRGMSLQIDLHMYFFACLAICVGWLNWRAILAYGLLVSAHHIVVGLFDSGAVFPDGYTIGRLAIHAGIVALEGAVLIWIIRHVMRSIATSRNALAEAQLSADQTNRLRLEAEGRAVADSRRRAEFQQAAEQLRLKMAELGSRADRRLAALNVTASHLSGVAGETMRQVAEAETAARDADSFVRQVAQSAAELAQAEREIGRQAHRTSGSIRNAAETARDMNLRVEKLADAARRIGDVVKLIEAVASQTNLLALNATIEAARAGDAGRGFAVVAQEVKALAGETARSTADIADLAETIREAAAGAIGSVRAIEAVMEGIDAAASTIAGAVDDQGAATEGISRSAERMVHGTEMVAGAIAGATGAAEEAESAASQVEDATRSVSAALAGLTLAVDAFLTDVLPDQAAA